MEARKLLNDTIRELEKEEQKFIDGGSWENAAYIYGAIAGGLSTCSFPVGMLTPAPYTGGGQICTSH